jgi:uncharacterized protein YndB with AHSA1/START domain
MQRRNHGAKVSDARKDSEASRRGIFDAVYNPKKITQYFATKSASGPLDKGTTVIWNFADYPGDIPVLVKKVVPNELISFEWEASDRGYNIRVEMLFEPLGPQETLVSTLKEDGKRTRRGWIALMEIAMAG